MLRAAHVERARAIVVTNDTLAEKMSICTAARAVNSRIAIVVTAANEAERGVAAEIGATFIRRRVYGVTDGCCWPRSAARSDRRPAGISRATPCHEK